MIDKTHINVFVDYSLSNLFGAIMVDPLFNVFGKRDIERTRYAWIVSLDQYTRTPMKNIKRTSDLQALDDYISVTEK
jgi:hypothetical protein